MVVKVGYIALIIIIYFTLAVFVYGSSPLIHIVFKLYYHRFHLSNYGYYRYIYIFMFMSRYSFAGHMLRPRTLQLCDGTLTADSINSFTLLPHPHGGIDICAQGRYK